MSAGERAFLVFRGWCAGNLIWPVYITFFNSRMFAALNGTVPHTMAYSSTPKPHMSEENPLYPLSERISGAIYAGVPHYSNWTAFGSSNNLLMPKSQILTWPFSSSRILSSLISLCMTDFEWQCATPWRIYLNKGLASSSVKALIFFTKWSKSPPLAYSSTMNRWWPVSNTSYSLITFWWSIAYSSFTSCATFSSWSGLSTDFSIIFNATCLFVILWDAK